MSGAPNKTLLLGLLLGMAGALPSFDMGSFDLGEVVVQYPEDMVSYIDDDHGKIGERRFRFSGIEMLAPGDLIVAADYHPGNKTPWNALAKLLSIYEQRDDEALLEHYVDPQGRIGTLLAKPDVAARFWSLVGEIDAFEIDLVLQSPSGAYVIIVRTQADGQAASTECMPYLVEFDRGRWRCCVPGGESQAMVQNIVSYAGTGPLDDIIDAP